MKKCYLSPEVLAEATYIENLICDSINDGNTPGFVVEEEEEL